MPVGGYRAGAGRKRGAKALQEQEIQHIVRGVTDFVKIANELYHEFMVNKNMKAAELLLAYGFGKPVQTSTNNTHVDIMVGFDKPQIEAPQEEKKLEAKAVDAEFIVIPEPSQEEKIEEEIVDAVANP